MTTASQRYIATYDEQADARLAAEAQLNAPEVQLSVTEAELEDEREARLAAEVRVRELEEKLKAQGER